MLRLGFLVLMMMVVSSPRAEADIWDWIDALNGPGPSHSRGNLMVTLVCSGTNTDTDRSPWTGRLFKTVKDSTADSTCLFFDTRRFRAEADERFHRVDIEITELGTSVRLHASTEIGAGIGWVHWDGKDPVSNRSFDGTRLTISVPRLVFKPFLAAPVPFFRDNADWGFFQAYFRETIVVGTLDQNDFPSKPGNVFSRTSQRVTAMGFIIDAPAALRLLHVLK